MMVMKNVKQYTKNLLEDSVKCFEDTVHKKKYTTCVSIIAIFSEQSGEAEAHKEASSNLSVQRVNY